MEQYIAKYFLKTKKIIETFLPSNIVTLQFFQHQNNVKLCGINEALHFLKTHTKITKYKIKYLPEGSIINSKEVVLSLEGNYKYFGIYEGIIDSILTRSTSIATNAYLIKSLTKKQIIFMGDRADHYSNQKRDGYAVSVGGIKTQVTDEHVKLHDGVAVGTIPHALIQMFKGDLTKTLEAYKKCFSKDKLVGLVDFNNDVIGDTLKILKKFQKNLYAIRIDTAKNLKDKMFDSHEAEYGVTPLMIQKIRKVLDQNNGKHVKIIISSGITLKNIMEFEKCNSPIDIYGIGSWLLKINVFFTADAVKINNQKLAKFGRKYQNNKKLIVFE